MVKPEIRLWYFCGQKRSLTLAGAFRRQRRGAFFMPLNCLHCTSEDKIEQILSVPSTAQKLRVCKPKEAFCFQRLRNLKKIFRHFLGCL